MSVGRRRVKCSLGARRSRFAETSCANLIAGCYSYVGASCRASERLMAALKLSAAMAQLGFASSVRDRVRRISASSMILSERRHCWQCRRDQHAEVQLRRLIGKSHEPHWFRVVNLRPFKWDRIGMYISVCRRLALATDGGQSRFGEANGGMLSGNLENKHTQL